MNPVFRTVAVGLMAVFYGAYLARQIVLRRRGIRVVQLGRGAKSRRTRGVEIAVLILTVITVVLQCASLVTSEWLIPYNLPVPLRWIGILCATFGTAAFALALKALGDQWRVGIDKAPDRKLVVTGWYQYTRNPAFVGFDLFYIGLAIALPSVVLGAAAVATAILLHFQVLEEERCLTDLHGADYVDYSDNTPRYLTF
jgi:protein-S-isoprenylcysteine O-methyltransferase Ste14